MPSVGHPTVGGGGAVSYISVHQSMLRGVSVYVHPGPASWNPVTKVEAPVVPMSPFITVLIPWLVIPAPPPKAPNVDAVPRLGPMGQRRDR